MRHRQALLAVRDVKSPSNVDFFMVPRITSLGSSEEGSGGEDMKYQKREYAVSCPGEQILPQQCALHQEHRFS